MKKPSLPKALLFDKDYYKDWIPLIRLLPSAIMDGKRLKKSIPKLPEALNPKGSIITDAEERIVILGIGESSMLE